MPSGGSKYMLSIALMSLTETRRSCPGVALPEAGDESRTRLGGGDDAGLLRSRSTAGEAGDGRR